MNTAQKPLVGRRGPWWDIAALLGLATFAALIPAQLEPPAQQPAQTHKRAVQEYARPTIIVPKVTPGGPRLSAMRTVTPADVAHPNVQAFLQVIRLGEGTLGPDGHRTLFGGKRFDSFYAHPNEPVSRRVNGRRLTSTAAGAYQFLYSTWQETARIMRLRDFTPRSQTLGAVGRIAARGALDDVKAGRQDAVCALQLGATPKIFQTIRPLAQPAIVLALAVSQPLSAAKAHTVHGGERVRLQARGPKENPRRKGERGVGMCGSLLTEPPLS